MTISDIIYTSTKLFWKNTTHLGIQKQILNWHKLTICYEVLLRQMMMELQRVWNIWEHHLLHWNKEIEQKNLKLQLFTSRIFHVLKAVGITSKMKFIVEKPKKSVRAKKFGLFLLNLQSPIKLAMPSVLKKSQNLLQIFFKTHDKFGKWPCFIQTNRFHEESLNSNINMENMYKLPNNKPY